MPYTAEISRTNPTCFLFLVDQSGSMRKPFGNVQGKSKAEGVADVLNRLLQNLVLKCAKLDGIRDYFHVGVVGYGDHVTSAFAGPLAGRGLVSVGEIANSPLRLEARTRKVDDGAGNLVDQTVKLPVWVEAVSDGETPMCQALEVARKAIGDFVNQFPNCYPPLVVNISDGGATDGTPEPLATNLRNVASTDGQTLLYNVHISAKPVRPIEYPDREDGLPDDYARMLFRMSSLLPPLVRAAARSENIAVTDASRGFVFNADLVAVIRFMDIGTRVAQGMP